MRVPCPNRFAFTLIELLIVVGILPITTLAMVLLINGIGSNRIQIEAKMNAEEASARTLSLWRQDVSAASAVRIAQDGRAMTLNRLDPEGKPFSVTYALAEKGRLIRIIQKLESSPSSVPQTLVESAADLVFSKVGAAYQIKWASEFSDGLHVRRWNQTGFAAPLLPGEV